MVHDQKKYKWLVIGGDGMIGSSLMAYLLSTGESALGSALFPDDSDSHIFPLDLTDNLSKWKPPEGLSFAYLCAAMSSIEYCEQNKEEAEKINVHGTCLLAKTLYEKNVFTVFPSTNLVFDGDLPYAKTSDPVNPTTEYGKQKVKVENKILSFGNRSSVVRFTKIVGHSSKLFLDWISKLKQGENIKPFSDMVTSLIPLSFAVKVLIGVAERRLSGIIQVSGKEDIKYSDIAFYIADKIGADSNLIKPILSREAGISFTAIPPKHTTLDASRLEAKLGMLPPSVWETIDYACGFVKSNSAYS
jgi:dTDP-4-dehydrorhamnose reductase